MTRSFYSGLIRLPESAAKRRKILIRAVISVGILALLLSILPLDALADAFWRVSWSTWSLVLAGFLFGHLVSAFKWRLLLGATRVPVTPIEAMRAHGAGMFANLCLPSVVGGDLIRAAILIRDHGKGSHIAVASLADRVNDTFALVLIAGIAGLFVPVVSGFPADRLLAGAALLLLCGVIAGLLLVRFMPADRLPGKLAGIVIRVNQALDALASSPGTALLAFCLSVLIQSGFILLNIKLAQSMSLDLPIALWFFAWPLAKLIALAPVSLGGIGVREVAIAGIMAPFGVDVALVVAQSLSWELVLVGSGIFAGTVAMFLPARRTDVASAEVEQG